MPVGLGPRTLRRLSWAVGVLILAGLPAVLLVWRSIAVAELAESQRALAAMV